MLAEKFSGKLKPCPMGGIGRKLKPSRVVSLITSKGKEKMKNYRNAIGALVLALVFSTSAFAEGIIWTDKTPPPPPTTQSIGVLNTDGTTSQADGVISTGIADPATETDTLTEITLGLLQTLIALL
ncbi:MAG TPA: hypothetical protein VF527_07840 [Pyrinomonadaceae bacterium]